MELKVVDHSIYWVILELYIWLEGEVGAPPVEKLLRAEVLHLVWQGGGEHTLSMKSGEVWLAG